MKYVRIQLVQWEPHRHNCDLSNFLYKQFIKHSNARYDPCMKGEENHFLLLNKNKYS